MTLRAYAERIGVNEETVGAWQRAANVAVLAGKDFDALTGYIKHLVAIHAAPLTHRTVPRVHWRA